LPLSSLLIFLEAILTICLLQRKPAVMAEGMTVTPKKEPTPSEAMFFFAIVKHTRNKADIDWDAVATEQGFKNADVAKVSLLPSTTRTVRVPRANTAGGIGPLRPGQAQAWHHNHGRDRHPRFLCSF